MNAIVTHPSDLIQETTWIPWAVLAAVTVIAVLYVFGIDIVPVNLTGFEDANFAA